MYVYVIMLYIYIVFCAIMYTDFLGGSDGKASAYNEGDQGSIPGLGRSPGEGTGTPLQYSCLENPMDGGAWWATVHRVTKSQTRLSNFTSLHFLRFSNCVILDVLYIIILHSELFFFFCKEFAFGNIEISQLNKKFISS